MNNKTQIAINNNFRITGLHVFLSYQRNHHGLIHLLAHTLNGLQGRRQVKQSGMDSRSGVWGGMSPSRSWGRVCGHNLKLISTLHNDSIQETPPGKTWGGRVHPSPPGANTTDGLGLVSFGVGLIK